VSHESALASPTSTWNNPMRAWLLALMIASGTCSASATEIRVMAAGSLKDAFTAIFADYTRQYGDSFTPVWGPSGVLRERLQAGEAFDIFASAALPHAQALTEAGVSGPACCLRATPCALSPRRQARSTAAA